MDITSPSNPKLKYVVKLRSCSTREESGEMIVEGYRECRRALDLGYHPRAIFHCPDLYLKSENEPALVADARKAGAEVYTCSKVCFEKIAYKERPDGLLMVGPHVTVKLADLKHNADLTRLESTTDKDINRTKRYKYAIRLLTQNNNQDNSLIIDMPYGEIKIENAEQAAYFLKHKCDACPRNNMYNPCSGYYANICNTYAENIADHFRTI